MIQRVLLGLLAWAALAAPLGARQVEITILHTTDVHGHILPTSDYDQRTGVGGLLRCASLIERVRQERPHVLLVDCGDLFQGSAESLLTEGRIMTRALEWLRYDAWILGNHEFDWGLPALAALHDRVTVPMLAANLSFKPGGTAVLERVRPFLIKEVDGVRVALVGLTTPGIPTWSRPDLLGDCLFGRSVEALRKVMPRLREADPDLIVLGAHQGCRSFGDDDANEINAVAAAFPEIDVIIGGHTHRVVDQQMLGNTLYCQAGYHAVWMGQVDLVYDTDAGALVSKASRVYDVGDREPRQPDMEAAFSEDLQRAEAYLGETLGATDDALDATADEFGRSPIQMLLCRAIAEAVDVDVVLHGALSEDVLSPGPITMADVWRVVPYENRIGVASLTPEELDEILEENAPYQGQQQFMGAYGLRYRLDPLAPAGQRVSELRLADGSAPHARGRLRVAFNSYVLASGGLRFTTVRRLVDRPEARLELTRVDTRNATVRYVRQHSPLSRQALLAQEGAR